MAVCSTIEAIVNGIEWITPVSLFSVRVEAACLLKVAFALFVEFLLVSLAYSVFSSLRIETETKVSENDNILSILCN